MKETNNISMNDSPEVQPALEKKPSRRPLFAVLISLLVVLSLLTAAFAVFTFVDFSKEKDPSGTQQGQTAFDYFNLNFADYIALTEDMVKGLTLPGYDSRVDEVTPENVEKYINRILLNAVALTEEEINQKSYSTEVKWSKPIDYADNVFVYIAYIEIVGEDENGDPTYERVEVPFFENAYMEPGHLQIGMEYFGEDFDKALEGKTPMETGYYEKRTKGEVKKEDTVLITYTATETVKATEGDKADTVKNHKNYQGRRMELPREDAAWVDALLKNYGTVGQYFAFDFEEDVNGDGVKEMLKYEGVIDAVIEGEKLEIIEAKLPEGFFGTNPTDKTLARIADGKTLLRFHINIDYTVPREANKVGELTKADINTINTFLTEGGALTFTPSNDISKVVGDKEQKGELTVLTENVDALKADIEKLEGEIETIEKSGKIANLETEIADISKEIDKLSATPELEEENAKKIVELQNKMKAKQNSLTAKEEELAGKKKDLAEKQGKLPDAQNALDAALKVARDDCVDFFTKELADTYEETVKMTKGQLIYDHLVKTLTFIKLPESEVEALEQRAKESVEYYYNQLSAAEKRNYRDIEAYAAVYFGYDEKDYNGYVDYIENYLAPYEIKNQLLLPAIYNAFINDESKLNAKIDAHIADIIESTASGEQPMTREQILANYEANAGKDYLRNSYAMPLVVFDFLAENNTVDFNMKAN